MLKKLTFTLKYVHKSTLNVYHRVMVTNLEELYSVEPPTKLRNKDEKFCPSQTSPFWLWVADRYFYGMPQKRFHGLYYKNAEKFYTQKDPDTPIIMFAPHHNWWDGMMGYVICNRIFKKEIRIMIEELNRFPLIRRGGAFSVNKKSPQASMPAIKYAIDCLGDPNNILYIFPEGIIKPPNHRPLEFQTGMTYIAEKAAKKYGKVALMPVAVNYCFLRENIPEILIDFGDIIHLTNNKPDRKEYTEYLSKILEEHCDKQINNIKTGNLKGYEVLFQTKLRWYRRIEQRLKKIDRRNSGV